MDFVCSYVSSSSSHPSCFYRLLKAFLIPTHSLDLGLKFELFTNKRAWVSERRQKSVMKKTAGRGQVRGTGDKLNELDGPAMTPAISSFLILLLFLSPVPFTANQNPIIENRTGQDASKRHTWVESAGELSNCDSYCCLVDCEIESALFFLESDQNIPSHPHWPPLTTTTRLAEHCVTTCAQIN